MHLVEFIQKNRSRNQRYEIIDYGVVANKLADRAKILINGEYALPKPVYDGKELSRIGDQIVGIEQQKDLFERALRDRKFRYVIDGLNVVYARKGLYLSLLDMLVKELAVGVGEGRVLIVLREYLASFGDEIGELKRRHECVDVCFLEKGVERLDDDFVVYAALKSGGECEVVSNDEFGQFAAVDAGGPCVFASWLENRRIGFEVDETAGRIRLKVSWMG